MVGFWEWRWCSQYGTYLIPAAIVSIMWQCVLCHSTLYKVWNPYLISMLYNSKTVEKIRFNFSHSLLHNIWILVCCAISWFNLAWVIKSPIVFWQKWEKYEGHIIQFWFYSDSITYLHSILLLRGVIAAAEFVSAETSQIFMKLLHLLPSHRFTYSRNNSTYHILIIINHKAISYKKIEVEFFEQGLISM